MDCGTQAWEQKTGTFGSSDRSGWGMMFWRENRFLEQSLRLTMTCYQTVLFPRNLGLTFVTCKGVGFRKVDSSLNEWRVLLHRTLAIIPAKVHGTLITSGS